MYYAQRVDGRLTDWPLSLGDLRARQPQVSWADQPDAAALAVYGYVRVQVAEPVPVHRFQRASASVPAPDADGEWWQGWTWTDWPLIEARAAVLAEVRAGADAALLALAASYPERETTTWGMQRSEAAALALDVAAVTPLLDAIAAASGEDRATTAARVRAKAAVYAAAAGAIIGRRRALEAQAQVATTASALAALGWSDA